MSTVSAVNGNSAGDWIRFPGQLRMESSGPFRRVFHTLRLPDSKRMNPALNGRILFISDLHFTGEYSHSAIPGSLHYRYGEQLLDFLQETIRQYKVEHILFGGDLLTYLSVLDRALDFFRELRVPGKKIGVYGNWDLKHPWISYQYWEKRWKDEAGLELLCNRESFLDGIRIYGMDEYRNGSPFYMPSSSGSTPNWLLTHNPDAIPEILTRKDLSGIDLILCGHTHGGQIRLPLFGAVQTSSIYWKHFEYGLYRHRESNTQLLVTAGLGCTLIRHRFFCPPEAVILDVKQDPAWNGYSTKA